MGRDLFDQIHDQERGRFGENDGAELKGSDDLHDFDLVLHAETHGGIPGKGAVLVSDNGQEASAVWIPKSQITFDGKGKFVQGTKKNGEAIQFSAITLHCPEWLAKEKGLL